MLDIQGLSIRYGSQTIMRDFSLQVGKGELVCLGGESGCGKTSLLNAVMGFVDYEGTIRVGDKMVDAKNIDEIRQNIAFIPQELSLPIETVREMVHFPFSFRANRHISFSEAVLMEDWKMLNLDPGLMDKGVGEISGGQRQRIMLSVAGMMSKPLLLVDEPTSALDFKSADFVLSYFRRLCSQKQVTVLAVSHHQHFSEGCDRTVTLTKYEDNK